jgi:hypothetical protein
MAKLVALVDLSLKDLKAMMNACSQFSISDSDFLETLAAHKCLIVTPWVVRANPSGQLARVAPLSFDAEGNIDKPRVLIEVAKEFRRAQKRAASPLGNRFSV